MTATGPDGTKATSIDSHYQVLPSRHGISLTLEGGNAASSDINGDGKSSDGDVVTFTLNVTNNGSVDLEDVEVQAAGLDELNCQYFGLSGAIEGCESFVACYCTQPGCTGCAVRFKNLKKSRLPTC